jgi:cytochrome c553
MKLIWIFWVCVLCVTQTQALDTSMSERTRACTHCHGEQGKAGPDGYYPRLAGKPAGYLFHQLQNFQQGRRHYDLMARLIEPLPEAYLRDMAQYFSNLHVPYPAPALNATGVPAAVLARGKALTLNGDASRGVPACVSCHGAQLTGVAPDVPGLLGLPLDYLNGQLGAWQSGQRRAHAPDCMVQVVKRLASDDLMAVAQYLARQPLPANTSPVSLSALRASTATQGAHTSASDWTCGSAPGLVGVQP